MKRFAQPAFAGLAALAVFALSSAATHAQTTLTQRDDGAVELSMDGRQFVVAAAVADSVAAAVSEHAAEPQELQKAIQAIVAEQAGKPGEAEQATAIAALALYYARGRSSSIAAIIQGAAAGNPGVPAGNLIALAPALQAQPGEQEAAEQQLAQLKATVENPSQLSPVQ